MTERLDFKDIQNLISKVREAVKDIDKQHVVQALACAAVSEVADMKLCKHSSCFMHSIAVVHQVVDAQSALLVHERNMTEDEETAQSEPEMPFGMRTIWTLQ